MIASKTSLAAWLLLAALFASLFSTTFGFHPFSTVPGANIALGGYDPVAYIETGKAIKGAPIFQSQWRGVLWLFKTKANLVKFQKEPEKYSPAVGGYCTAHMAEDKLSRCDPTEFVVHKGKLYVFGNRMQRKKFLANPEAFARAAEANYSRRLLEIKTESGNSSSASARN